MLREAIGATLSRRSTDIPTDVPFGLTEAFATVDYAGQLSWPPAGEQVLEVVGVTKS